MVFSRPDIIRPPSEARSYFLPFTWGCSNNTCSFCNFYGLQLKVRALSDIKKEIDALSLYMKHGLRVAGMPNIMFHIASSWDGRRVFLQDGDALAYPYPQLVEALSYLNEHFPNLDRIASYATTQDILRRSVEELKELKRLKLRILYLGVETGDDSLLAEIGKGVTSSQIIEAGKKLKSAGIINSVTVILGLGGPERSQEHAIATANILTQLDPEYAGALTLTLIPNTPMYERHLKGQFSLISPMQSLQELKTIIEHSSFTNCFFSSMHASNYLSVRGTLPGDKNKMLSQLDFVLSSQDTSFLRPEFLRGL